MNPPLLALRTDPQVLADAFSEFIAAAGRLEHSYQELQKEVVQLRTELQDRNTALQSSLAENERMRLALQRLVGALPCGVLVFDHSHEITLMNSEAMRLLDLNPDKVRTLADIEGRVQVKLPVQLESDVSDCEQEILVTSASAKRWIALRNRKVGARERQQTIVILRDVSAQKEFEQEREAARNTVALAEMSAVLAHEIRNPLASLELFAGLIADSQPKHTEFIGHLQAGIRTLSATVNNVLRFNSAGHLRLAAMPLATAVQGSVEFMRPIAEQSAVRISFTSHAADLRIAGDENALHQVMLNLGCNAIRHMSGGGELMISVRPKMDGDQVGAVVLVSDTGSGIHPDHIDRIFDAGFSGNGHTPGLGLAVCRRIIEQHKGKITVTSRLNEGTTFQLEFPSL